MQVAQGGYPYALIHPDELRRRLDGWSDNGNPRNRLGV